MIQSNTPASDASYPGLPSAAPISRERTSATQALIVGGGPSGLAAAIALRQRGIDCTVVEARAPGIDKACGEGLMPDARKALSELGVQLTDSDGHPFHGIRFENLHHRVDAAFPHGTGIGVRRPRLHSLLAARAEAVGARLLWNSRVELPPDRTELSGTRVHQALMNGEPLRFHWLIGADGLASSVRRWAGLDRVRRESLRYGFRTHYRAAPWSDFVEIHWGRGGQLYITPVASDCVCVVYITRDRHASRANILADFPAVARHLEGAEIASQQRGAVSASRTLHRVAEGCVALVGDASGSADSITGEGLAMSFRQALALADSLLSGGLEPYRRAHQQIARLPHAMGSLMLTLDRWPALEVRAMRALATSPRLFDELLSVHMGVKSLASVALRRAGLGLESAPRRAGMNHRNLFTVIPRRHHSARRSVCFPLAFLAILALVTLATSTPAQKPQSAVAVELNPATTSIHWTLNTTLHAVHGTFKLKSGAFRVDPATGEASGMIVIDAASGESGDSARDKRMHNDVLESPRFPTITFRPTRVEGSIDLTTAGPVVIDGVVNLHGQDHPLQLTVNLHPNAASVTLDTHFSVPFVAWGLKDPSTFIFRVEKQVALDVEVGATPLLASPSSR